MMTAYLIPNEGSIKRGDNDEFCLVSAMTCGQHGFSFDLGSLNLKLSIFCVENLEHCNCTEYMTDHLVSKINVLWGFSIKAHK